MDFEKNIQMITGDYSEISKYRTLYEKSSCFPVKSEAFKSSEFQSLSKEQCKSYIVDLKQMIGQQIVFESEFQEGHCSSTDSELEAPII